MGLSREEIAEIAKTTAQEVVNNLHRYAVTYEEPKTVEEGLVQSRGEELTAADWYDRRANHALLEGDDVSYELYQHIANEERQHYDEFGHRLHSLALSPSSSQSVKSQL